MMVRIVIDAGLMKRVVGDEEVVREKRERGKEEREKSCLERTWWATTPLRGGIKYMGTDERAQRFGMTQASQLRDNSL